MAGDRLQIDRELTLPASVAGQVFHAAESECVAAVERGIRTGCAERVRRVGPASSADCETWRRRIARPLGYVASHLFGTKGTQSERQTIYRHRPLLTEVRALGHVDSFRHQPPRKDPPRPGRPGNPRSTIPLIDGRQSLALPLRIRRSLVPGDTGHWMFVASGRRFPARPFARTGQASGVAQTRHRRFERHRRAVLVCERAPQLPFAIAARANELGVLAIRYFIAVDEVFA